MHSTQEILCGNPRREKTMELFSYIKQILHSFDLPTPTGRRLQAP